LARNIEERESLIHDQKKEISSLKENVEKINSEIDEFEADKQ